jgi:hypothetical protein
MRRLLWTKMELLCQGIANHVGDSNYVSNLKPLLHVLGFNLFIALGHFE